MEVRNKRLDEEKFQKERQEVLATWPTGREVDIDEAIEFHKTLIPHRNYALKVAEAKKKSNQLIRIDSGVATIEGEIELFRCLQDEGGADLLGSIVDSFTRVLEYERAEEGLKESQRLGKTALNGFPMVVHGVKNTRKVIEAVNLPVQLRSPAVDTRLVMEIALASGHTSVAGGAGVGTFISFSKDALPEIDIHNGQYAYRLMGHYQEKGIPIAAEPGWGFPHTTPYSLGFTQGMINIIAAAEQGVRHIIFGIYGQTGNLAQDVAALCAVPNLGNEYLNKLGYHDVQTSVMTSCYGGIFPEDTSESYAVICLSALTGMLARTQIIHVKTIWEGKTIPSMEASAASLRAGKKVINMMKDQSVQLDNKAVEIETRMIEMETRAIMDRVLEVGDGDVIKGLIKGLEIGLIDPPFATTKYAQGKVMAARDNEGAMRYLDHGNLPFSKEILDFHKEKLAEREKAQGRKIDYQNVVDDLLAISKGALVTRCG
jgi:methylaspartate mutase epsilon subunit